MKILNRPWFSLVLLLILLCFAFFAKLGAYPLRIWDEARNANNALHMLLHDNWLVPFYEGAPDMWNTKPPLLIWMQVVSMKIFGISDVSIRIPTASGALLTGILIWYFFHRVFRLHWLGFIAALVLMTSPAYFYNHGARTGDYDTILNLFILLYSLSLFHYSVCRNPKLVLTFWIFLSLAVLTKGIVAFIPLPGLFLFVLLEKQFRKLVLHAYTYWGFLLFLLIVGGYYLGRELVNPGYLQAVYNNELGGRYLTTLEGHHYPFWFYTENLTHRFNFYFLFLIPAFIAGFMNRDALLRKLSRFNLLMILLFWLIISLGQTKLDWYDLPLYPFMSMQVGIAIFLFISYLVKQLKLPVLLTAAGCCVLIFAYPLFRTGRMIFHFTENQDYIHHQPGYFLKHAIRKKISLNNHVICFEGYSGQIQFYIRQLQQKGSTVHLQQDVSGLVPGNYAVVNQESLRAQIKLNYQVIQVDEKYGCTVYLVQQPL